MSVGADPRLGTVLAGYRLVSVLGRGGMGAVYLADDVGLARHVAVKVLLPDLAASERFRERFLRESRLAASIEHPHIVPIYQAGEADGVLFIAMRYIEGGDLRELLVRDGPLEPERALRLVGQVGSAVDAAHGRGLVHRDVKPGNVLLVGADGEEHCYLGDFGLTKQATSLSGLTETGNVIGTVEYIAPEQVRGEPVEGAADRYALACVLYECLTGRTPFERESEVATLWAHVQEPPPPVSALRSDLPRALDTVFAAALAKDPSDRYPTCAALGEDAREALRTGDSRGRARARGARRAGRRLARRQIVMLVVTALAAAAIASGAVLVARPDRAAGIESLAPNSVGVIDPATNRITAEIPVGAGPAGVAVGAGAVWVANRVDGTVSRIHPKRRTVERTIPVADGARLTAVAAGAGGAWVGSGIRGPLVVSRIDPAFNRVAETRTLARATFYPLERPWPLALGNGSLWAATGPSGTLFRLAPRTLEIVASSDLAIEPAALTVGGGNVWVANPLTTVVRVDPRTTTPEGRYTVAAGAVGIAFGYGAVWVAGEDEDVVSRIDQATGSVTTIPVGDKPSAVSAGEGAVWVVNSRAGTVSRIDPETRTVVATIEIGGTLEGVAVGAGAVWVTVAGHA